MKITIPGRPQLVLAQGAGRVLVPLRSPSPTDPPQGLLLPLDPSQRPQTSPGAPWGGFSTALLSPTAEIEFPFHPQSSWGVPWPCPHIPAQTAAKDTTIPQGLAAEGGIRGVTHLPCCISALPAAAVISCKYIALWDACDIL